MKILIVGDFPTHPAISGNRTCTNAYAELLRTNGHEVYYFFTYRSWSFSHEDLLETMNKWQDHITLHRQTWIDRLFQNISKRLFFPMLGGYPLDSLSPIGLASSVKAFCKSQNIDAVVVNYWHLSASIAKLKNIRRILYAHDRFGNKYHRTGSQWLSTTPYIEGVALSRFDCILAIQSEEARYFRTITDKDVIVSYCPFQTEQSICTDPKVLMFISGKNEMNIDGLATFINNVWPIIRSLDSKFRLAVGGSICEVNHPLFEDPGVLRYGKVDNLSEFYSQGAISINPVFRGSGLKIKTFEALSYGKVVVCHPHSAEGMFDGIAPPIFKETDPKLIADYIYALANDPARIRSLSETAHQYIHLLNRHVSHAFQSSLSTDGLLRESDI